MEQPNDLDVLTPLWDRFWKDLQCSGLRGGDRDGIFQQLIWLYTDPSRKYHTLAHIRHCFAELAEVEDDIAPCDLPIVEGAIWFHDAVYIPGHPFSEAYSAVFFEQTIGSARDDAFTDGERNARVVAGAIADYVRATSDHRHATDDPLLDAFLDIDLAIFGRPPAEYAAYADGIRFEYQRVPEPVFRERRIGVLESFLKRRRIYGTDYFHAKYEAQARTNLPREIAALTTAARGGLQ